jgi:hypothetical protein
MCETLERSASGRSNRFWMVFVAMPSSPSHSDPVGDYEKKRAEIIDSLFEAPCQEIANRPDGPWPPESVPGPFHRYERHIHTGFFQRGIK